MKPLTYTVSNYGTGIAVGIAGDKQLAEQDAILAENIYGYNHIDYLFDYTVYMPDLQSLKKFFTIKEYFKVWDEHWTRNRIAGSRNKPSVLQFTRRAIKRAKLIMESQVKHENFMYQISSRNTQYQIGSYQDEVAED